MIWIIHLLVIIVFAGLIKNFSQNNYDFSLFLITLSLKLISGILLGCLYFYFYKIGDTIHYFDKSVSIASIFDTNPSKYIHFIIYNKIDNQIINYLGNASTHLPRSIFFIKILSILNLFTGSNYWLNSLYLSLFCFAGSWKLYSVFIRIYPENKIAIIFSFLILPSTIFWSSGVLKESILLGSLYFCIANLVESLQGNKKLFVRIIWIIFNIWLLFNLKVFVFAIFVPIILAYTITFLFAKSKALALQLCIFSALFISMILTATNLHYSLSIDYFLHELVAFHNEIIRNSIFKSSAENTGLLYFNHLTENIYSIAKNAPQALINGLFMPLYKSKISWLQAITSIENVLLLILSLWSFTILLFKKKYDFFKIALLVYVCICACIFGLASPNIGTLARYKVVYIPFFVYIILSNFRLESIKKC